MHTVSLLLFSPPSSHLPLPPLRSTGSPNPQLCVEPRLHEHKAGVALQECTKSSTRTLTIPPALCTRAGDVVHRSLELEDSVEIADRELPINPPCEPPHVSFGSPSPRSALQQQFSGGMDLLKLILPSSLWRIPHTRMSARTRHFHCVKFDRPHWAARSINQRCVLSFFPK